MGQSSKATVRHKRKDGRVSLGYFALVLIMLETVARAAPSEQADDLSPYKECVDGPSHLQVCELHYLNPQYASPDHRSIYDVLPQRLVVSRNGRRLYSKGGLPFVWGYGFVHGGQALVFEAGPKHSSMTCTLLDAASGRELDRHLCFSEADTSSAPPWVREWTDISTEAIRQPVDREDLEEIASQLSSSLK